MSCSASSMASDETPEQVIARIADLLTAACIPYMLTGSFASGFHGGPRAIHPLAREPYSVGQLDPWTGLSNIVV
jgi:hypothetical protein